ERWPDLQPTWAALADVDPARVIVISQKNLPSRVFTNLGGLAVNIKGLPLSKEARVWDAGAISVSLDRVLTERPADACLCEVDVSEMLHFRDLLGVVLPYVDAGGKIVICVL